MKEESNESSTCSSKLIPSKELKETLYWILFNFVDVITAPWRLMVWYIHQLRTTDKIPGPPANFIFGNVLDIYPLTSESLTTRFFYLLDTYGSVFRAFLGPALLIVTTKQETHERVLSGNEFLGKGLVYAFLKPWLGDGLLMSSGEKWKSRRRILTPAFHFKILDQFVPVFHSCGDELVRQLRKRADGSPFDVWPITKLFTLDVICETTMGVKINAQTNSDSPYVTAVNQITGIFYERVGKPWLYIPFVFGFTELGKKHQKCLDILHGTTERVIRERKEELKKLNEQEMVLNVDDLGRRRRVAFLDLLLLAARDGSLSDRDIREEVDTFMFEGHDTTAAALSFTLFLLSSHPEVQDKMMEELESVFDPSKPLDPTLQQLSDLKYIEMVLKEGMRIYPPVPAIARYITKDIPLDTGNWTAPGGTTLFLVPCMLHRNPEVFPDPETFDPERFSPEESARRHPFAYLPFSAGPRNCIGQRFAMLELKSILAKVIWNFRILPDPDYAPNLIWEVITKTNNGIYIKLEERRRDVK